jgi:hypothetical protein
MTCHIFWWLYCAPCQCTSSVCQSSPGCPHHLQRTAYTHSFNDIRFGVMSFRKARYYLLFASFSCWYRVRASACYGDRELVISPSISTSVTDVKMETGYYLAISSFFLSEPDMMSHYILASLGVPRISPSILNVAFPFEIYKAILLFAYFSVNLTRFANLLLIQSLWVFFDKCQFQSFQLDSKHSKKQFTCSHICTFSPRSLGPGYFLAVRDNGILTFLCIERLLIIHKGDQITWQLIISLWLVAPMLPLSQATTL